MGVIRPVGPISFAHPSMAEWVRQQAEREAEKEQKRLERLQRKLAEPRHCFASPAYQQQCHEMAERLEDSVLKGESEKVRRVCLSLVLCSTPVHTCVLSRISRVFKVKIVINSTPYTLETKKGTHTVCEVLGS